jgi:hypothetical protein
MTLPPKLESNLRETWPVDSASLERDLQDLSVRYRRQCSELPLPHKEQLALAKLYAGARRLCQALREGAVADAIVEIGSNLMGCEQMALLILRDHWTSVAFLGSVGLDLTQLEAMRMNAREIIKEAPEDDIYIESDSEKPDQFLSSLGITAYVPLWLDSTTRGAIVFFNLLPQRNGLDSADRELLRLLCAYAGPCLSAGKVRYQEILG